MEPNEKDNKEKVEVENGKNISVDPPTFLFQPYPEPEIDIIPYVIVWGMEIIANENKN